MISSTQTMRAGGFVERKMFGARRSLEIPRPRIDSNAIYMEQPCGARHASQSRRCDLSANFQPRERHVAALARLYYTSPGGSSMNARRRIKSRPGNGKSPQTNSTTRIAVIAKLFTASERERERVRVASATNSLCSELLACASQKE